MTAVDYSGNDALSVAASPSMLGILKGKMPIICDRYFRYFARLSVIAAASTIIDVRVLTINPQAS